MLLGTHLCIDAELFKEKIIEMFKKKMDVFLSPLERL